MEQRRMTWRVGVVFLAACLLVGWVVGALIDKAL